MEGSNHRLLYCSWWIVVLGWIAVPAGVLISLGDAIPKISEAMRPWHWIALVVQYIAWRAINGTRKRTEEEDTRRHKEAMDTRPTVVVRDWQSEIVVGIEQYFVVPKGLLLAEMRRAGFEEFQIRDTESLHALWLCLNRVVPERGLFITRSASPDPGQKGDWEQVARWARSWSSDR